jgi:hypothetical protein
MQRKKRSDKGGPIMAAEVKSPSGDDDRQWFIVGRWQLEQR